MAEKRMQGFAALGPEKRKEISSLGGKAAHSRGSAHQYNSQEASEAGKKGGEAVSRDREHMSAIGRKGGHARGKERTNIDQEPDRQASGPGSTPADDGS